MKLKRLLVAGVALLALASCQKEVEYHMTLSTKELSVGSDGGTFTFTVDANVYYRVNNDCEFAKITDTQTNGNVCTFTVEVRKNSDEEARSSQIRFIGDHVTPLKLMINQRAFVPYGVSVSEINVDADATEAFFDITGEKDWTASVDNAAFKLSSTSGSGASTIKVSFPANNSEDNAVCTVTVTINGEQFKVVISQKSKFYTGVDPQDISVAFGITEAEFNINTQKSWTASSDNSKFVPSPASGTGSATVKVSFPENSSESAQTANITVKIEEKTFTVKITQGGAPKKEYVDLSAKGTSNCYIVSSVGYYKFKATVAGNGCVPPTCEGEISATIAPASASVLWCTYNTTVAPTSTDAIIKGVELKDGYIQFSTDMDKFVNSNAVIAAYNAAGTIVWSWHIWLTDEPSTSEIGGAWWMDRNLGAVVANIKGDVRSCGLLYQWGRKDPMRSASSYTDGEFIATYPPMTEDEVAVNSESTIASSIANPRPFINTYPGGSGPKDWIYDTKAHNDRWMDSQKTMFDPCPQGYRVPSSAQMVQFGIAGGIPEGSVKYSANDAAKTAYNTTDHVFETAAWSLPMCGVINYNNGTMMADYGSAARYVTSTDNAAKTASVTYFNANSTACNFANVATPGHASAARCVKE